MITFATSLKTEKILYKKSMCMDGYIYIQTLPQEYIHSESIKSLSGRTTLNFKKMVNSEAIGDKV